MRATAGKRQADRLRQVRMSPAFFPSSWELPPCRLRRKSWTCPRRAG